MFELHSINGKTVPKIICDSCGKEISNAKAAAIVFKNFMEPDEKTTGLFVHKDFVGGNCLSVAEAKIRSQGARSGWLELSQHLAYVVSNVGLTAEDIKDRLNSP